MQRTLLILVLLGLRLSSTFAGDIPVYRKYQWDKAGATTTDITNWPIVNMGQFGCDASGTHSNNDALEKAIEALGETGGIIQFKGGEYLFTKSIHIPSNIVLKGNGASTDLVFDLEEEGHAIRFTGAVSKNVLQLTENGTKGLNYIEIANGQEIEAGDFLKIVVANSELAFSDWARNSIGQIVQIKQIEGNRAYLHETLRLNVPLETALVTQIIPVKNAGVQCLAISRRDQDEALTSTIQFENAMQCFVRNIRSSYSNFAHVEISKSSHITVEGCQFQKAHQYGEGGQGYGVVLQYTSGDNLIQNNIFEELRHAVLLQAGANGNVVAYNFSIFPNWDQPGFPSDAAGDIVLHGNYPFANLFEGNVVQNIVADNSHGKNGYHNTFYKNEIDLYGLFANPGAIDSLNLVGNNITNRLFLKGNYIIYGEGHYENYNLVKDDLKPRNSSSLSETSLFLSEMPTFITNSSGKKDGSRIEAENRYYAKSPVLCGSYTPHNEDEREKDKNETEDTKTTSVGDLEPESWSVFPNPATNNIQIEGTIPDQIILTQLNGSTVYHSEGSTTLSVGHLPRGMYLLKIRDQEGRSAYKKLLLN